MGRPLPPPDRVPSIGSVFSQILHIEARMLLQRLRTRDERLDRIFLFSKMAKAQEEERRAIAAYLAGQFDDSCLPRIRMAADYHGKSTKFAPWNL